MKIAVVGAGVAGSYLSYILSKEHKVEVFERFDKENFDSICAWGTCERVLSTFAKKCGVNFDDYILFKGKELTIRLSKKELRVRLIGLCTFDKTRFLRDLVKGLKVNYGKFVNRDSKLKDYKLIIDASGVLRSLLPKLENDLLIPCILYKVKFKEMPYDDFYVEVFSGLTGYLWFFPLGNNLAYVGAGDFKRRHIEAVHRFLKKYNFEVLKKAGKAIRILPPSLCKPIQFKNVVGVGEAIGTVFPLVGEGIIPSLQSAEILLKNLFSLDEYERKVLNKFTAYNFVFRFIKSKLDNRFSLKSNLIDIIAISLHLKLNQERYGFNLSLSDVLSFYSES